MLLPETSLNVRLRNYTSNCQPIAEYVTHHGLGIVWFDFVISNIAWPKLSCGNSR
jgi:hypothetical protein